VLDERKERVARNETRFREINENLRTDLEKLPSAPSAVAFVCECGLSACTGIVEMGIGEYEAVRASSRRFLILPGHEIPDTERVIERLAGYFVVEKDPDSTRIVDAAYRRHGNYPDA
jgi:hypothetical protein